MYTIEKQISKLKFFVAQLYQIIMRLSLKINMKLRHNVNDEDWTMLYDLIDDTWWTTLTVSSAIETIHAWQVSTLAIMSLTITLWMIPISWLFSRTIVRRNNALESYTNIRICEWKGFVVDKTNGSRKPWLLAFSHSHIPAHIDHTVNDFSFHLSSTLEEAFQQTVFIRCHGNATAWKSLTFLKLAVCTGNVGCILFLPSNEMPTVL